MDEPKEVDCFPVRDNSPGDSVLVPTEALAGGPSPLSAPSRSVLTRLVRLFGPLEVSDENGIKSVRITRRELESVPHVGPKRAGKILGELASMYEFGNDPITARQNRLLNLNEIPAEYRELPLQWAYFSKRAQTALKKCLGLRADESGTPPTLAEIASIPTQELLAMKGVGVRTLGDLRSSVRYIQSLLSGSDPSAPVFASQVVASVNDGWPEDLLLLPVQREFILLYGGSVRLSKVVKREGIETFRQLAQARIIFSMDQSKFLHRVRQQSLDFPIASIGDLVRHYYRLGDEAEEFVENTYGLSSLQLRASGVDFQRVGFCLQRRRDGASLEEIGGTLGITRERARQIVSTYTKYLEPEDAEVLAAAGANRRKRTTKEGAGSDRTTALNVATAVLNNPGISMSEIERTYTLSEASIRQILPKEIGKFIDGFTVAKQKRGSGRWSDDELVTALKLAGTYAFPLSAPQYDELVIVGEVKGPGSQTVAKRFGTWKRACRLAGVETTNMGREYYSHKWSWNEMVDSLVEYLLDPSTTGTSAGYESWRVESVNDLPSLALLRNTFGTWADAVTYALVEIRTRGPIPAEEYLAKVSLRGRA